MDRWAAELDQVSEAFDRTDIEIVGHSGLAKSVDKTDTALALVRLAAVRSAAGEVSCALHLVKVQVE